MWVYLASKMRGLWDAQRHEDKYSVGIPDLSFAVRLDGRAVDGWIELKTILAYPTWDRTRIKIRHLKAEQVNWMERRARSGSGSVFLLLAVGRSMDGADWYLLPVDSVRDLYEGKLGREDLAFRSVAVWGPTARESLAERLLGGILHEFGGLRV